VTESSCAGLSRVLHGTVEQEGPLALLPVAAASCRSWHRSASRRAGDRIPMHLLCSWRTADDVIYRTTLHASRRKGRPGG